MTDVLPARDRSPPLRALIEADNHASQVRLDTPTDTDTSTQGSDDRLERSTHGPVVGVVAGAAVGLGTGGKRSRAAEDAAKLVDDYLEVEAEARSAFLDMGGGKGLTRAATKHVLRTTGALGPRVEQDSSFIAKVLDVAPGSGFGDAAAAAEDASDGRLDFEQFASCFNKLREAEAEAAKAARRRAAKPLAAALAAVSMEATAAVEAAMEAAVEAAVDGDRGAAEAQAATEEAATIEAAAAVRAAVDVAVEEAVAAEAARRAEGAHRPGAPAARAPPERQQQEVAAAADAALLEEALAAGAGTTAEPNRRPPQPPSSPQLEQQHHQKQKQRAPVVEDAAALIEAYEDMAAQLVESAVCPV